MLRLVFFLSAGLVLGSIVAQIVGPPGAGVWGFPVGITLAALSGTFIMVAKTVRGVQLPSSPNVTAARAAGRLAVCRIDALRQTGTRINDQPLCELEITVQPRSGQAFRTSTRIVVPVISVPNHQPGTRRVVALITEDGPEVALLDDDVSEWSDVEIPAASAAGPLRVPAPGSVRRDGSRRGPIIGIGKRGRALRYVVFALAIVAGATVVVLPYRVGLLQTVEAIQSGRMHADLRQPEVLAQAIASLEREIGHGTVSSVVVFDDMITVEAPITPGERASDDWIYRGGTVEHVGPSTIQPDDAGEQFEFFDVDWSKLMPAVSEASALTEVRSSDETSFSVSRGSIGVDGPTPVRIVFSFDDPYRSAWFEMNADGSGLELTNED